MDGREDWLLFFGPEEISKCSGGVGSGDRVSLFFHFVKSIDLESMWGSERVGFWMAIEFLFFFSFLVF